MEKRRLFYDRSPIGRLQPTEYEELKSSRLVRELTEEKAEGEMKGREEGQGESRAQQMHKTVHYTKSLRALTLLTSSNVK
ncbi:hypothetical protein IV203_007495 [Nitzschia inconspicua]|uniref:Uncharacterized protein n=1 Tax=Nitzschia inconspicua TaxID=303405 RepID=A0A9K3PCA8_9STRA|nr:hypothetical protein IV203_007495 [Nitzschia inconspicua]